MGIPGIEKGMDLGDPWSGRPIDPFNKVGHHSAQE